MHAVGIEPLVTPEDLLSMPDGRNFELVDGNLVERNMSVLSSWVGGQVFRRVDEFVSAHDLGTVWPADNGYQCFPDDARMVRRADAAFVKKERLSAKDMKDGFLKVVPDLVVEVISPNDLAHEVERKVSEYLTAGVPLVWIIEPESRTLRVQRGDGSGSLLKGDAVISGESVLPGFEIRLRLIFPPVETAKQA
jgi:Uma2 family endonuclease